MKKKNIALAFCVLISTGKFQVASLASGLVEEFEEHEKVKQQCAKILPDLTHKLNEWRRQHNTTSPLPLPSEFTPAEQEILELAKNLGRILIDFRKRYFPKRSEIEIAQYVGVRKQIRAIRENYRLFCDRVIYVNNRQSEKECVEINNRSYSKLESVKEFEEPPSP